MKAIVLLSGGIDSLVVLAHMLDAKKTPLALTFDYGQRHRVEIEKAKKIAEYYKIPQKIITIDPETFGSAKGYALVDLEQKVQILNTYVPARNTLFLAYAAAFAEIFEAEEIGIGVNICDRNGFPDTRPEFLASFEKVLTLATKQAENGTIPKIFAPFQNMTKEEIVDLGFHLKAPMELTWSCYDPIGQDPCGKCGACELRTRAFSVREKALRGRS
jgi:7-cyano-7-deazaguanine synthase